MDNLYLELIHKEIDGVTTSEEQAQLKAHLATNPESQALHDDLVSVAGMLDRAKDQEPPPHLKDAILKALPTHKYARTPQRERSGFLATLIGAFQVRSQLAYAYTFSLGLLLGLGAFALFTNVLQPASADLTGVYGTIGLGEGILVEEVAIDESAVQGTAQVRTAGDLTTLELDLSTSQPLDVHLNFDEQVLSLTRFAQQEEASQAVMTTQAGKILLTTGNKNTYVFTFHDNDASDTDLHLQFRLGDDVLYEQSLATRIP